MERTQRRPQEDELGTPDDPPPVYEATPNHVSEQTLEYGPLRPFQPAPVVPPRAAFSPPPSNLPPPSFPFWNGAGLTPQQTGFVERANEFAPPNHAPPGQPQPSFAPPPGPPPRQNGNPPLPPRPRPPKWAPTTVPTPGQPFLNKGRVLVYPAGHFCSKCGNTGYKFNDPDHPCRKDWEKYSKPFTAAFRLAPDQDPAPNFQKPLRDFDHPHGHSTPMNQGPRPQVFVGQRPPPNANVLVLRPGDPRMGGVLCRNCDGRGNVVEMWSFFGDEETCPACRGAGRVF